MRRGFIERKVMIPGMTDTMAEAVVFQSPNQLRRLFVLLLLEYQTRISNGAQKLWEHTTGSETIRAKSGF
jgi:hypothetical protein